MIKNNVVNNKYKFPFVIVTPKEMKDGLPLLVQLHGAGERGDGSNLEVVEIHGFPKVFTPEREIPCILVMPQCPMDSFWAAKVPLVYEFILQIVEDYHCDVNRIYLTGLSMGGYGTWFTAMAYPKMFAAIAPCCGGGMPWNAHVLTMPVWAFHGAKDEVVFPYESENMVNAMKKAGLDAKLTIFPECGHNCWDSACNEELLNWFLSKSK